MKLGKRIAALLVSMTLVTTVFSTGMTASAEDAKWYEIPTNYHHVGTDGAEFGNTSKNFSVLETLEPTFFEPNSSQTIAQQKAIAHYTFDHAVKTSGGWNWVEGYWDYLFGMKIFYHIGHWNYTTPINYTMYYNPILFDVAVNFVGLPSTVTATQTLTGILEGTTVNAAYLNGKNIQTDYTGIGYSLNGSPSITVSGSAKTITLEYSPIDYTLTVKHVGVPDAVNPAAVTKHVGDAITAAPLTFADNSYRLTSVTVNGQAVSTDNLGTMPASDTEVVFTYAANQKFVVKHQYEGKDAVIEADKFVAPGAAISAAAYTTPDAGYKLGKVLVNGEEGTVPATMTEGALTVIFTYDKIPYEFSVTHVDTNYSTIGGTASTVDPASLKIGDKIPFNPLTTFTDTTKKYRLVGVEVAVGNNTDTIYISYNEDGTISGAAPALGTLSAENLGNVSVTYVYEQAYTLSVKHVYKALPGGTDEEVSSESTPYAGTDIQASLGEKMKTGFMKPTVKVTIERDVEQPKLKASFATSSGDDTQPDDELAQLEGHMPYGNVTVVYTYERESYALTVKHVYNGVEDTAKTTSTKIVFGAPVAAKQINKSGYTFAGVNPAVPATMPANALTITFSYSVTPATTTPAPVTTPTPATTTPAPTYYYPVYVYNNTTTTTPPASIPNEQVPLANTPVVNIPDEIIPEANPVTNGEKAPVAGILATVLAAAAVFIARGKRTAKSK